MSPWIAVRDTSLAARPANGASRADNQAPSTTTTPSAPAAAGSSPIASPRSGTTIRVR